MYIVVVVSALPCRVGFLAAPAVAEHGRVPARIYIQEMCVLVVVVKVVHSTGYEEGHTV